MINFFRNKKTGVLTHAFFVLLSVYFQNSNQRTNTLKSEKNTA